MYFKDLREMVKPYNNHTKPNNSHTTTVDLADFGEFSLSGGDFRGIAIQLPQYARENVPYSQFPSIAFISPRLKQAWCVSLSISFFCNIALFAKFSPSVMFSYAKWYNYTISYVKRNRTLILNNLEQCANSALSYFQ